MCSIMSMGNDIYYYNAADVVVLSSFAEGSPNVIGAMAQQCLLLARMLRCQERFHGVKGCYQVCQTPKILLKIVAALEFNGAINSREVGPILTQIKLLKNN